MTPHFGVTVLSFSTELTDELLQFMTCRIEYYNYNYPANRMNAATSERMEQCIRDDV